MARRRPVDEFSNADKIKILLWCDRHCCLCGKACGVDIEVAHIDGASGDIDNAIPLCYDCHAKIGHYNTGQPRGTKYKFDELKTRREQIYEQHTRHLVPPIEYYVTQNGGQRKLPAVGFYILHRGDALPVQVTVRVDVRLRDKDLGSPPATALYDGSVAWNLNPLRGVNGWFPIHTEAAESKDRLEVVVTLTVIDQYTRRHPLLPVSWVFMREENSWFAHPSPGLG
jgi:hypothetical protein